MTFEAHFRLPSSTQYAYSELRVSAETAADLTTAVEQIQDSLGVLLGQVEAKLNGALTAGEHGAVPTPVVAVAPVAMQDVAPAVTPPASAAPPWAAPASAEPRPKPWEKPAMPAAAAPAPAQDQYTGPRVKLPFLDQNDPQMAAYIAPRQEAVKQFYARFKNSFGWNKEEKCYRFHHNPDAATLAELNKFNAEWGGEIL